MNKFNVFNLGKAILCSTMFFIITIINTGCHSSSTQSQQVHKNSNKNEEAIHRKVDSLLKCMTLQEKIGQLSIFRSDVDKASELSPNIKKRIRRGEVGALYRVDGAQLTRKIQQFAVDSSRLGIPLLFAYNVVHGFRTIFPVPLGEAATWNPHLIGQADSVAAREASSAGLQWTFAPMVDITRDPRWGRIVEGAGEDPYLGSQIAAAAVRGFQGNNLKNIHTVAASVKHFAGYGAAVGGRDYNTVNMSRRLLQNVYMPPYKAAVDAGTATVMSSFNEFNGVPATGNKVLLNQILRNKWKFNGFLVSDYKAIPELMTQGIAKNKFQAIEMAINAGVDMDMQSGLYIKQLPKLVKKGKVSNAQVNQATGRILTTKFRLGLFENPYRYSNKNRQRMEILSKKNREKARQLARESMVLLKNNDNVLPLNKDIKNLAVIGPLADNQQVMLGPWSGAGRIQDNVSMLKGIREAVSSSTQIHYAKGTDITDTTTSGFDKAVQIAQHADKVIMALGESRKMSGEASSRATLDLPGNQLDLLKAVQKTGAPVVLVLMNGRPLTITWAAEHVPSILETWFAGTEGGHAISDVLFGDVNPSGKLPITIPRNIGQVPIYYDHKNTGRPTKSKKYIDLKGTPLYPFGYGLSYTNYQYNNLTLSTDTITTTDSLKVSINVTNTGSRSGTETAQLYIRDMVGSVTRPIKELKGFKKVFLQPGQTKQIHFLLTPQKLSYYNIKMENVVESGNFKVFVGKNSKTVLSTRFNVKEND